jgi:pimeloyl-ACP methyl ester carboxylesterase
MSRILALFVTISLMKSRLNELTIPTDRWSARLVSPVDLNHGLNTEKYGDVVVVHPGWAKAPERHIDLLTELADNGFLPIGIDTRYAYSDLQRPRKSIVGQPMRVGAENPYFPNASRADNRWTYRRPTALLDICRRLGIEKRSYVGHSDGGRIVTLAALGEPEKTDKLVIVNAAGTGDSSRGLQRLMDANANRLGSFVSGEDDASIAAKSALGSVTYAVTHPRRTLVEKHVIQSTNTWALLDELHADNVDATVIHARGDEMISFEDSARSASERSWVDFIPTDGGHSNIYETSVRKLIIQTLQ